jgi:hypothetical protein
MPGMPPLHIRVLCAGSARLGVLGPLEQSDLVGLDLTKNIHDTLMPDLDVTPRTHPYLEALIDKGDLGTCVPLCMTMRMRVAITPFLAWVLDR